MDKEPLACYTCRVKITCEVLASYTGRFLHFLKWIWLHLVYDPNDSNKLKELVNEVDECLKNYFIS